VNTVLNLNTSIAMQDMANAIHLEHGSGKRRGEWLRLTNLVI